MKKSEKRMLLGIGLGVAVTSLLHKKKMECVRPSIATGSDHHSEKKAHQGIGRLSPRIAYEMSI